MARFYRLLLGVQGIYTLLTALWGLIDIDSFMQVTGPKNDIWLVKTVSAILAAIGITFISFALEKKPVFTAIILGMGTAVAVGAIDLYYTANEIIRWVYGIDAMVELIFLSGWLLILVKWKDLQTINHFNNM